MLQQTLLGHKQAVRCVQGVYGNGAACVISGSDDHTLRVWSFQIAPHTASSIPLPAVVPPPRPLPSQAFSNSQGIARSRSSPLIEKKMASSNNSTRAGDEQVEQTTWSANAHPGMRWSLPKQGIAAEARPPEDETNTPTLMLSASSSKIRPRVSASGIGSAEMNTQKKERRRKRIPIPGQVDIIVPVKGVFPPPPQERLHVLKSSTGTGHKSGVLCLEVAGDSIYSGGWDGKIFKWDRHTGECEGQLNSHISAVLCLYAPSMHRLACDVKRESKQEAEYKHNAAAHVADHGMRNMGLRGKGVHTFQTTGNRHTDATMEACRDHDDLLFSGSSDNSVIVWSMSTTQKLRVLAGHTGWIKCLASSGRLVITGSTDNTLRVWDLHSVPKVDECLMVFVGHQSAVLSLAVGPSITTIVDGGEEYGGSVDVSTMLVSGSRDMEVRVWRVEDGSCIHALQGHSAPIHTIVLTGGLLRPKPSSKGKGSEKTSVDGQHGKYAITGAGDDTIRIWLLETGVCKHNLVGHNGPVTCLCVGSDEMTLFSAGHDGTVRVWSIVTGECHHILRCPLTTRQLANEIAAPKRPVPIRCLALLGVDMLITGSDDSRVRLWRLPYQ